MIGQTKLFVSQKVLKRETLPCCERNCVGGLPSEGIVEEVRIFPRSCLQTTRESALTSHSQHLVDQICLCSTYNVKNVKNGDLLLLQLQIRIRIPFNLRVKVHLDTSLYLLPFLATKNCKSHFLKVRGGSRVRGFAHQTMATRVCLLELPFIQLGNALTISSPLRVEFCVVG